MLPHFLFYWIGLLGLVIGACLTLRSTMLLLTGIRAEADIYYLWIDHARPVGPYIRYTTAKKQVVDIKVIQPRSRPFESDDEPVNPARRKVDILYFPPWPRLYIKRNFLSICVEPLITLAVGVLLLWAGISA